MDKLYAYDLSLSDDGVAARTLNKIERGSRVLEVGCASGSQSKILKSILGCAVTAIEINPDAAEHAKPYCERILIGSIEQLDTTSTFENEKFDVILFADVLEHLYDPLAALKKVTPLLKDSGHIVASIPNIAQISVIYDLIYGKFEYTKTGILDDTHIRFFTRKTVVDLFTNAGLLIETLDRGLFEMRSEKLAYPKNDADRAMIEFVRTHNPECMTSHFIVKASPSRLPTNDLELLHAKIQLKSLEDLALFKESRTCEEEALARKLTSDLAWQNKGIFTRVLRKFGIV